MNINEKLAQLRKEKKLTQAAVAKELDVSTRSYLRWERGTSKPGKAAIKRLSDYFGVDLTDEVLTSTPAKDAEKAKKPGGRKIKKVEQKKPAPKKNTPPKDPSERVPDIHAELQYAGKAIPISEIFDRAKEACGNKADKLNIYIKPEESMVYFVSDGNVGSFEL